MRLHTYLVLASSGLAAAVALLAAPGVARADETAAPAAASAATPNEKPSDPTEADRKKISIELNPVAIAIGRYSIQGEYMPAAHHALTLNPFYAHAPVTVTVNGKDIDAGALNGFGGELGYRFYTGSKGMNGFFIGPSAIFASYSQSAASGVTGASGSDSFMSYGGAIDLGGQAVIGPGIVVGGGFGLQYTKTSKDIDTANLNLASAVIAGGGVRPRFLASVGYAF